MEKNAQIITWAIVALVVGVGIGWMIPKAASQEMSNNSPAGGITTKQVELKTTMRKLWDDHDVWTRSAILSIANSSGDKDAVIQRLLKNPDDIGNAVKSYYGDAAGSKVASLLKDHLSIAAEIVEAAKAGDSAKQKNAEDRWFKNGDDIAVALSQANPNNWKEQDLKGMMRDHLNLVKQEAVDVLGKKWPASVTDYDKIHDQTMKMADMLSDGIIKQFPDKFS
ncbi:glycosyltransferase [Candidatus Parcubacteria bacterium]|nr:glycosyltransferase [Candidatus Parcubacteria bacterium]